MQKRLLWPLLSLLAAMLCLEGALPGKAAGGFDPGLEQIQQTLHFLVAGSPPANVKPGDAVYVSVGTSVCGGCGGNTQVVFTVPSFCTALNPDVEAHHVGNTITLTYPNSVGFSFGDFLKVADAQGIPAEATEFRVTVTAHVVNEVGSTFDGTGTFAVPLANVPFRLSKKATTPRPDRVSAGEEVTWTLTASGIQSGADLTITDPLPDKKLGAVVPAPPPDTKEI